MGSCVIWFADCRLSSKHSRESRLFVVFISSSGKSSAKSSAFYSVVDSVLASGLTIGSDGLASEAFLSSLALKPPDVNSFPKTF